MEFALTSHEIVYGLLRRKINEPFLIQWILKLKREKEEKDTRDFYIHQWNTISGYYYSGVDRIRLESYSSRFSSFPMTDFSHEFFNVTGKSYQVVYMINLLLVTKDPEKRRLLDEIYGHLTITITQAMKSFCTYL